MAVVATFAVRVHLATSVGGPILASDAAGYLGNGRWLAGVSTPDFTFANAYGLGYSFLLAPLYALGLRPEAVVLGARIANAAMASMIAVPIAALVREMWPGTAGRASAIGIAVSLSPALLLQSAFVWPETLLPLLFACWCLACIRYVDRCDRIDLCLVVGLALAAALAHDRALPLVAVTMGLLLIHARASHGAHRRASLVGAASVLLGVAGVRILTEVATEAMWSGGEPASAERGASLLENLSPGRALELTRALVGQGWYVSTASLGLVVVGAAALVVAIRRREDQHAVRRRLGWGAVLFATAGLTALSVVFMTDRYRVDHLIYGRYNEMWVPVLAALGLGYMSATARPRRFVLAVAIALPAIGLATAAIVGADRLVGSVMPLNVLGAVGPQVLLTGAGTWITEIGALGIGVISGACLLSVMVVARWRAAPALAGAAWAVLALVAHHGSIAGFREFWLASTSSVVEAVESYGGTEPVAIELTGRRAETRNVLAFWFGDEVVRAIAPGEWPTLPVGSLVVAGSETSDPCLVLVVDDPVAAVAVWEVSERCDDGG